MADLCTPSFPRPEIPGLPQKRHIVLYVHRVTEDVAFQGRHGLLEPEKEGVAGAQADLKRAEQSRG